MEWEMFCEEQAEVCERRAAELGDRAWHDAATRFHPDTIAAKIATFHRTQIERWHSRLPDPASRREKAGAR